MWKRHEISLIANDREAMVGKKNKHGGRGQRGKSKGGRGGARGGARGGGRSGRGRDRSFRGSRGDDINTFPRGGELTDDFISLTDKRNNVSVKLNKKLRLSKLNQINDMVALNGGDFTTREEMSLDSMMYPTAIKKRYKNRENMYNEVRYTNMHREEIFKRSYRKSTIEFVKANEVYDPSKQLLEKLAGKNNVVITKSKEKNIVDIEEQVFRQNQREQQKEEALKSMDPSADELPNHSPEEQYDLGEDSEENLDDLVENSEDDVNDLGHGSRNNLDTSQNNDYSPTVNFEQLNIRSKRSKMLFVDDNAEEAFNISYDEELSESENETDEENKKTVITDIEQSVDMDYDDDIVLDSLQVRDDECDSDSEEQTEIQIGKFLGKLKVTKNGDSFIELPSHTHRRKNKKGGITEKVLYMVSDDDDDMDVDDVVNLVNKKLSGNVEEEKEVQDQVSAEPEFGFLEEDYVSFDITQIKVENIRVGSSIENQQYLVQAPYLFGFADSQWISRDDFIDFLVEKGFPEHRFSAFIKSVTIHLVSPSAPDTDSKVGMKPLSYVHDSGNAESDQNSSQEIDSSDDSSLQSDSEFDEELMEGLDDLLSMHKSSKNFDYDPQEVGTKSIKVRGKKKNLQLEVNTEISQEFQEFMKEKYLSRKENKKDKKEERAFARKYDVYMLKKYPYFMEMSEIIEEFKDFHADPLRNMLRFPPLDFHVNLVLKAIASAFRFSSMKVGNGKTGYLKIIKPTKMKNKDPDWKRINELSKKRSVCFRMDVELSREEKRELKRIKGGRVDVDKMKKGSRGNFSYKEGEIVGANAKEIDASSKGRQLLEMMGWQIGDALGPSNNKGIIEPIRVVVKTSKKGIM